ncbi:hypothetical protein Q7A53_05725 [Halobacillus rhizosphaerae]|uniref:hypothetical protein n=1 Tax=Halobacillus rhizosphaerae TaxID=3064889 RepID=UPI00398A889C
MNKDKYVVDYYTIKWEKDGYTERENFKPIQKYKGEMDKFTAKLREENVKYQIIITPVFNYAVVTNELKNIGIPYNALDYYEERGFRMVTCTTKFDDLKDYMDEFENEDHITRRKLEENLALQKSTIEKELEALEILKRIQSEKSVLELEYDSLNNKLKG